MKQDTARNAVLNGDIRHWAFAENAIGKNTITSKVSETMTSEEKLLTQIWLRCKVIEQLISEDRDAGYLLFIRKEARSILNLADDIEACKKK